MRHAVTYPPDNASSNNDLIILNPNWLTTTIFGPIFARENLREDYHGIPKKQLYTLADLQGHFRKIKNPGLLVDLLEYFELAFK